MKKAIHPQLHRLVAVISKCQHGLTVHRSQYLVIWSNLIQPNLHELILWIEPGGQYFKCSLGGGWANSVANHHESVSPVLQAIARICPTHWKTHQLFTPVWVELR